MKEDLETKSAIHYLLAVSYPLPSTTPRIQNPWSLLKQQNWIGAWSLYAACFALDISTRITPYDFGI